MRRLVNRFRSDAGHRSSNSNTTNEGTPPSSRPAAAGNQAPGNGPVNVPTQRTVAQPTAVPQRPTPTLSLHDAAAQGSMEIAGALLAEGVPVDSLDSRGRPALHLAIMENHVDMAELLLNFGANIESTSGPMSIRPLHLGLMTLNTSMIRMLLRYHPNLESTCNGLTPLFYAITCGDTEIVELLLQAGASAKAKTLNAPGKGESVLHMAVGSFANSTIPLLIRYGADVNVSGQDPAGQTALHIAAQYGNEEALRMLIDAGTDIHASRPNGENALYIAVISGRVNTATILIERGLDPTNPDGRGTNSAFLAAMHGQEKMLTFLLNRYESFMPKEVKIEIGVAAAGAGYVGVLRMLRARGYPITESYDGGDSALSIACYLGRQEAVIYLLQQGANPWLRNRSNATSFDMARRGKHKEVLKLLEQAENQRKSNPRAVLFPDKQMTPVNSAADTAETYTTLMSVNATRRIHANQEPAGIFACQVCKDFHFRRGMPKDAEVVFFTSVASTHAAAARGCRSCQFLSDCLAQASNTYGPSIWGKGPMPNLVLHSMAEGAPLLLHLDGPVPHRLPSQRIEVYVEKGSGVTWPIVGTGRDVATPGWPTQRANIAKDFLRECTTQHAHCHYQVRRLPTRVIRVGSEGEEPRLYISNRENANYIALSHCWGGVKPLITTTDTLEARTTSIPYHTLPKTFQDAVMITRSLGVEYLWIDSLCIIQDSAEDWAKEAASMKDVYANCYVMISADDSPNPHGGCVPTHEQLIRKSHVIDSVGPKLSKVRASVRLTHLRDPFHMEVCHRIGDPQSTDEYRSILNQRGWCLQERILAPRVLHFGQSELAWECPETVACECQTVATGLDKESRYKAMRGDYLLRQAQGSPERPLASGGKIDILLWMHFVEEFTRRNLTFYTDILHALTGLADFMETATRAGYVCGIWKRDIAEFLLWTTHKGSSMQSLAQKAPLALLAPSPFGLQSSSNAGSAPIRPKRHESYIAPSWSWASVIAPISFMIGRLDISKKFGDQISHISKEGTITTPRDKRIPLLESVDIKFNNDLGSAPKHASLTVTGLTLPVTWTANKKSRAAEFNNNQSKNGGTLLHPLPLTPSNTASLAADFEPDQLDADLDVSIGAQLVLLYVIKDIDAVVPDESGKSTGFGVKGTRIQGLVLHQTLSSGDESLGAGPERTYRRIGVFEAIGDRWENVASKRTVVLL